MQLTKHHGLGNDFLVLLIAPGETSPITPALARQICDRHRGVGADGLIVGRRAPRADIDLAMTLYNADGSLAEISGNGIRCLAQAEMMRRAGTKVAVREGSVSKGAAENHATLRIETVGGLRIVTVEPHADSHTITASVAMGHVCPGPALPPAPAGRRAASAAIGNPHWVVLVDDAWAVDVAQSGPQHEALVEGGINVEFISVDPKQSNAINLAVWERGVGITQACGSGASAAAHTARQWGLVGDNVTVTMPGGAARVVLDGDEATLVGPSVFVARVELANV